VAAVQAKYKKELMKRDAFNSAFPQIQSILSAHVMQAMEDISSDTSIAQAFATMGLPENVLAPAENNLRDALYCVMLDVITAWWSEDRTSLDIASMRAILDFAQLEHNVEKWNGTNIDDLCCHINVLYSLPIGYAQKEIIGDDQAISLRKEEEWNKLSPERANKIRSLLLKFVITREVFNLPPPVVEPIVDPTIESSSQKIVVDNDD
jgi:hypothetical protein